MSPLRLGLFAALFFAALWLIQASVTPAPAAVGANHPPIFTRSL